MSDRKEWELTLDEMNAIWQSGHEYYAPGKIAKAAARKALEWAAKKLEARACAWDSAVRAGSESDGYESTVLMEQAASLRKELSDG